MRQKRAYPYRSESKHHSIMQESLNQSSSCAFHNCRNWTQRIIKLVHAQTVHKKRNTDQSLNPQIIIYIKDNGNKNLYITALREKL